MPVAVARVKPLSPIVIHDGAAFTTPALAASAQPRGARRANSLQVLVVHLRHFSGYVGGKIIVCVWALSEHGEEELREETMRPSRGKLVASFAAVILGGVVLALLGVAFTSSDNPPMAPATPAPATPGLAAPEKQVPLKPALPLGISRANYLSSNGANDRPPAATLASY
jgi:hypothetical protein